MNKRTDNRGVAYAFGCMEEAVNSNGQYYSTGHVIYSYGKHWPLAAWIRQPDGSHVLHINDDKYSTTTAKQRSFMVSGVIKAGGTTALNNAVHHSSVADIIAVCEKAGLRG